MKYNSINYGNISKNSITYNSSEGFLLHQARKESVAKAQQAMMIQPRQSQEKAVIRVQKVQSRKEVQNDTTMKLESSMSENKEEPESPQQSIESPIEKQKETAPAQTDVVKKEASRRPTLDVRVTDLNTMVRIRKTTPMTY